MTAYSEIIGYIAATLTTLSFLPQAILTIKTRDTKSLSLTMYSAFTLGVSCWLVYGILIQNNVVIVANSVTLLFAGIIFLFKIYHTLFQRK